MFPSGKVTPTLRKVHLDNEISQIEPFFLSFYKSVYRHMKLAQMKFCHLHSTKFHRVSTAVLRMAQSLFRKVHVDSKILQIRQSSVFLKHYINGNSAKMKFCHSHETKVRRLSDAFVHRASLRAEKFTSLM